MMRDQPYQNDTVGSQPYQNGKRQRLVLSPIRQSSVVMPCDLIFEILLRLPVRSLLQFRCVCKSWKTLISDPQFVKNHLRCSAADPSMTHHRLVSSVINEHCDILFCPVKPLFESKPTKAFIFTMSYKHYILGSCNGLLCLYDGCVRLWNPATRLISKKSPTFFSHDFYGDGIVTYTGFGYDQVNDKYKALVAREMDDTLPETVTKVYTIGTNSMTTIQNFPCPLPTTYSGKFVSGTLNWAGEVGFSWVLLSFDLEKETYKEMLLPQQEDIYEPMLDVLSNCLCVCFESNKTPHWVVWLMKKYGVAESWTKLTIIPHRKFWNPRSQPYFYPLCISGNGRLLVKSLYHSKFFLYDPNNGRLDHPRILTKLGLEQHIYHESLVSPPLW